MRSVFRILVLLLATLASCSTDKYSPDKYLSDEDQINLIRQTVYYSTKLPPNASEANKYNPEFVGYYNVAAQETELMKYYKAADGTNYFLMSRKARSITPMREGIAGTLSYEADKKVTSYVEVFRTWKMVEDTLAKRGAFLFDRMVQGKDLTMYYSKFQQDRYIEFPDDRFVFDLKSQHWRDRELDTLRLQ